MGKNAKTALPKVFLDFDNTITRHDVLDDMLERFSINDKWLDLEDKWKRGRIGSRDCLAGQIAGIRITKDRLDKYLATVRIDPYFKKLIRYLDSHGIKPIILSDNFDYILKKIFALNGIRNLSVFSNKVKLSKGRLIPTFLSNGKCLRKCAHCKKKSMRSNSDPNDLAVYVGDGLSDVCASKEADIVFAKDSLDRYLKERNVPYVAIKNLKDVYDYFRRTLS